MAELVYTHTVFHFLIDRRLCQVKIKDDKYLHFHRPASTSSFPSLWDITIVTAEAITYPTDCTGMLSFMCLL